MDRVTVFDADVGHGGTSHFFAQYYKHSIVVIEFSPSHPDQSRSYVISNQQVNTDLPVVLLSTQDVNHDKKPDLVIQIQGAIYAITLYNNGQTFQEEEPQS